MDIKTPVPPPVRKIVEYFATKHNIRTRRDYTNMVDTIWYLLSSGRCSELNIDGVDSRELKDEWYANAFSRREWGVIYVYFFSGRVSTVIANELFEITT